MHRLALLLVFAGLGCREQPRAVPPASSRPIVVSRSIVSVPVLATPTTSAALWATAAATNKPDGWVAAALALQRELADCTKDCLFLAHEVVETWSKATRAAGEDFLTEHEVDAVPPITRASIAAIDTYVSLASPSDPEVERLQLDAAITLDYRDQLVAIPRLEAFVNTYRDEDRTTAANFLLDSLIRNHRAEELGHVVSDLIVDPAGLDPDLLTRTESLRAQLATKRIPAGG